MMNIDFKVKWGTAVLGGILLILAGVVGMFIPLVPEVAVILLGMWLLSTAAVIPLGRWKLHHREEKQLESAEGKEAMSYGHIHQ